MDTDFEDSFYQISSPGYSNADVSNRRPSDYSVITIDDEEPVLPDQSSTETIEVVVSTSADPEQSLSYETAGAGTSNQSTTNTSRFGTSRKRPASPTFRESSEGASHSRSTVRAVDQEEDEEDLSEVLERIRRLEEDERLARQLQAEFDAVASNQHMNNLNAAPQIQNSAVQPNLVSPVPSSFAARSIAIPPFMIAGSNTSTNESDVRVNIATPRASYGIASTSSADASTVTYGASSSNPYAANSASNKRTNAASNAAASSTATTTSTPNEPARPTRARARAPRRSRLPAAQRIRANELPLAAAAAPSYGIPPAADLSNYNSVGASGTFVGSTPSSSTDQPWPANSASGSNTVGPSNVNELRNSSEQLASASAFASANRGRNRRAGTTSNPGSNAYNGATMGTWATSIPNYPNAPTESPVPFLAMPEPPTWASPIVNPSSHARRRQRGEFITLPDGNVILRPVGMAPGTQFPTFQFSRLNGQNLSIEMQYGQIRVGAAPGPVPAVRGQSQEHRNLANYLSNSYEALSRLADVLGDVSTGLSAASIAQLPTFRYTSPHNGASASAIGEAKSGSTSSSDALSSDNECVICLGQFETGEELRILTCLHKFHTSCIDPWLGQKGTCPTCRERPHI